jgi:hypothetical protein
MLEQQLDVPLLVASSNSGGAGHAGLSVPLDWAQGNQFLLGLAIFGLGFIPGGLCYWDDKVYFFTPFAWWLFSLIQATGLLMSTLADGTNFSC